MHYYIHNTYQVKVNYLNMMNFKTFVKSILNKINQSFELFEFLSLDALNCVLMKNKNIQFNNVIDLFKVPTRYSISLLGELLLETSYSFKENT